MSTRFLRLAILAAVTLAAAGPASAQLARTRPGQVNPNAPKLLAPHFWFDSGDSAVALLVADGARDRLRITHGTEYNTLTRQIINENLMASGFPPDVPLEQTVLRTLARFLNARYVIEGKLTRTGNDSIYVTARLYEAAGQLPQSANVIVGTTRQRIGTSTGAEIANRLMEASRSFADVQRCRNDLETGNHPRAIQRANDALRDDPNSTGAYLCIASVLEAQNAPGDSIIRVLRVAHEKDTLNTIVMRRLAQKYEVAGDTNGLVSMLRRILTIDRRDNELRIGTARLFVTLSRYDDAIAVIDQGLETNPASLELLGAKGVALGTARRWADAGAALAQVAEIDSNSVDSLFLYRVTNYFREAADTTRWYRWVQVATVRTPSVASYWFDAANLAMAHADTTASIAAARVYVQLRPDEARGRLLLARPMIARGELDSGLAHAEVAAQDSLMRPFAGQLYLTAGFTALRDSAWQLAEQRLQRAKDLIPEAQRQQFQAAAFYLSLSQVQQGIRADNDAQNNRSCDAARLSLRLWNNVETNVILGVAVNREQANQILQAATAYKARAEQFITNLRCPPEAAAPGR